MSVMNVEVRRALKSHAMAKFMWWYAALLIVTFGFKVGYLRNIYNQSGLSFIVTEMAEGSGHPRALVAAQILSRDVIEVAFVAAITQLLVHYTPRRFRSLSYAAIAVLLLAILGINLTSFAQLGTFTSYDTVVTTILFILSHGHMASEHLTPRIARFVLAAVLLVSAPLLAFWLCTRSPLLARAQTALGVLALGSMFTALTLVGLSYLTFPRDPFPLHGAWTNIVRAAVAGGDRTDPRSLSVPEASELLTGYERLTVVDREPLVVQPLVPSIEDRVRPRHILVVGLETAPAVFYPLSSGSPDWPTFTRMSGQAIVSDRHYTSSPYTRIANFSMLSGVYPPPSGLPSRFGSIAGDSLASRLRDRGYRTHYIDSWVLDWLPGSGERQQARDLGFEEVTDRSHERDDGSYEQLMAAERASFDLAFETIARADAEGRKAMVFLGTMLGHYPWVTPRGRENDDARAKLRTLVTSLDTLFGRLLEQLDAAGLEEEILVLIVGDHGLRYAEEFASVGTSLVHDNSAFNVPFLLYAPGLVEATVRLSWATSHVDITPTLLHLVGVPTAGMLHHGRDVLDPRLAQRAILLLNGGLRPVDGILWKNHYITHHGLTGASYVGDGADVSTYAPLDAVAERLLLPKLLRDPGALLGNLSRNFELVAGALRQRAQANRSQTEPRQRRNRSDSQRMRAATKLSLRIRSRRWASPPTPWTSSTTSHKPSMYSSYAAAHGTTCRCNLLHSPRA